jgi:hypothetical protein
VRVARPKGTRRGLIGRLRRFSRIPQGGTRLSSFGSLSHLRFHMLTELRHVQQRHLTPFDTTLRARWDGGSATGEWTTSHGWTPDFAPCTFYFQRERNAQRDLFLCRIAERFLEFSKSDGLNQVQRQECFVITKTIPNATRACIPARYELVNGRSPKAQMLARRQTANTGQFERQILSISSLYSLTRFCSAFAVRSFHQVVCSNSRRRSRMSALS